MLLPFPLTVALQQAHKATCGTKASEEHRYIGAQCSK